MGLMFDDENELKCTCGSMLFIEREEYMIDKKSSNTEDVFIETRRAYNIRCAECNKLISSNMTSKIQKL